MRPYTCNIQRLDKLSIEFFRLEKTLEIIESNHKLITAKTTFLVVVEHDKVSPEPSFKPPQFSQLFLINPVF